MSKKNSETSPVTSDEEPITIIEGSHSNNSHRPSQLSYNKTRVVDGKSYIDTSLEDAEIEAASSSQVSFVAADLQERIRMSSPPNSAGTTATTSSGSPSPYPPLIPDPQVLLDLESHASEVASQLDRVIQEFSGSLHGMTSLSEECMDIYGSNVGKTCDAVDMSIKSMYQMLAKAEELSKVLKPVPRLAQQIREIKRILDLFEVHMQKSSGF